MVPPSSTPPIPALRLHPNDPNPTWIYTVANIRLQAPACYALQVDGLNFMEIIVFEARPAS